MLNYYCIYEPKLANRIGQKSFTLFSFPLIITAISSYWFWLIHLARLISFNRINDRSRIQYRTMRRSGKTDAVEKFVTLKWFSQMSLQFIFLNLIPSINIRSCVPQQNIRRYALENVHCPMHSMYHIISKSNDQFPKCCIYTLGYWKWTLDAWLGDLN